MAERRGRHFIHLSESLLSKPVENRANDFWPTFQRSMPSLKTGPRHWWLFNPIQIGLTHGPTKRSSVENFSIPFEWDWQPRYMPNGGKEIRWPMKNLSKRLIFGFAPPLLYSQFQEAFISRSSILGLSTLPPEQTDYHYTWYLLLCYSSSILLSYALHPSLHRISRKILNRQEVVCFRFSGIR